MRTCVVIFTETVQPMNPEHLSIRETHEKKYPDSYATVGPAGNLNILREADEAYPGGDMRKVARTVAIYAPGSWRAVSYVEES